MSRRRRYRKPYHKKRRPWYAAKNMAGYASTAVTALKIARAVQIMVNVESKFYDIETIGGVISTSGTFTSLCDIVQGDTGNRRDGNKVKVTSLCLEYMWSRGAEETDIQRVRVVIFSDKSNNEPGVSDPTQNGDAYSMFTGTNIMNQKAQKNWDRYGILYDKIHVLGENGNTGGLGRYKYYKSFVNKAKGIGGRKLVYDGSVTLPASKGNLWLYMMSDSAADGPVIRWTSRIRFIDN